MRNFFSWVIALFCGSSAYAFSPMNVLFIGNSYTLMNSMPDIFQRLCESKGVKINVVMDAKANHTFRMHCDRKELFKTIKSKKWDYVVMQGFSRELSFDPGTIDSASIPYFQQIADSVYAMNKCTNILLYETWGYRNGFPIRPDINTYDKMQKKIEEGYKYLSTTYHLPIVPVGNVFRELRKNYPDINLYVEDNQHPTFAGSYASACAFYVAIFKSSPENSYYGNLSESVAKKIQKTAFNYVYNKKIEFGLDKEAFEVKYEITKESKYVVYCKSNFEFANSVKWDFGDGKSSPNKNETHYYKTAGEFLLKLVVDDECGQRIYYRQINLKPPLKPIKATPSKPKTGTQTTKKI